MNISPVGVIKSDFKQRFAIPRQPLLVESASAVITLDKSFSVESVKGLDEFSHLWVIFHFHNTKGKGWKEVVRPPRLGGKEGRGVFATRSPFRPNPIGLSVVKFEKIAVNKDGSVEVHIVGGDFLDKTPVLDIKPYVPYVECLSDANSAWASKEEERIPVCFEVDSCFNELSETAKQNFQMHQQFIKDTLSLDPRPAYERKKDGRAGQTWSVQLAEFDITWMVTEGRCVVTRVRSSL